MIACALVPPNPVRHKTVRNDIHANYKVSFILLPKLLTLTRRGCPGPVSGHGVAHVGMRRCVKNGATRSLSLLK